MSGAAQLEQQGPGRWRVSGELSFATVPELARAGMQMLAGTDPVEVDLGGVRRSDSAGVALLVEWLRQARQRGVELRYSHLPEQMRNIIRVAGLDRILPVDSAA